MGASDIALTGDPFRQRVKEREAALRLKSQKKSVNATKLSKLVSHRVRSRGYFLQSSRTLLYVSFSDRRALS